MTHQTQVAAEGYPRGSMDEQGFQGLYEQFNRPLYNFFVRRGFSREEGRDMVQETFLAAYDSRRSFRGESTASTWLFGIATNVWRAHVRDSKRLKRDAQVVSLDEPISDRQSPPPSESLADAAQEGHPLRQYLADERHRLLYDALHELPEKMRLCVVLHLRGYKYREIADVLKVSLNTVRSQLFDAREKLRVRLAGDIEPFSLSNSET